MDDTRKLRGRESADEKKKMHLTVFLTKKWFILLLNNMFIIFPNNVITYIPKKQIRYIPKAHRLCPL